VDKNIIILTHNEVQDKTQNTEPKNEKKNEFFFSFATHHSKHSCIDNDNSEKKLQHLFFNLVFFRWQVFISP
jgi:hypothetical protein